MPGDVADHKKIGGLEGSRVIDLAVCQLDVGGRARGPFDLDVTLGGQVARTREEKVKGL